jgi:peptidoglycan/xylan/chitin deacetylase (PgdA/CDA1 family)
VRRLPSVDVVVDASALARNESGAITGPIWLRDGDPDTQADFPEVGWVDFPVSVLVSWVQELQRLTRTVPSSGAEAACHFMDGPYYFTLTAESAGGWLIRCYEARERTTDAQSAVHEWRTGSSAFLASAIRASRAVLSQCDARGWWNRDTEVLRRSLESGSRFRAG